MSCIWRKGPAAPCACAYRLNAPLVEVLNHLPSLGTSTLMLKQDGLSVVRSTHFGLSIAYGGGDWRHLVDRVSGLESDTAGMRDIYLLRTAEDPRPLLATGAPGAAVDLSIRLDGHTLESSAIRRMIDRFQGAGIGCGESRRLGAGAWLDDWSPHETNGRSSAAREVAGRLSGCAAVEVEVRTAGHRAVARFRPEFVDHDGVTLRLADSRCRTVVYADTDAVGFQLEIGRDGTARIHRHHPEAA